MKHTAPHYLLLTQAKSDPDPMCSGGVWRFVLEQIGSSNRIEVAEEEPGCWGERLQLLAVVRGLEALDQPSRVTLITPSRFVGNGIRRGIVEWRINGWQWEGSENKAPIQHRDLWKRVDQALQFHQVNCRIWDFDETSFRSSRPAVRNRISFGEIENARLLLFSDSNSSANPDQSPGRAEPGSVRMATASALPSRGNPEYVGAALGGKSPSAGQGHGLAINVKPIGAGRAFGYASN